MLRKEIIFCPGNKDAKELLIDEALRVPLLLDSRILGKASCRHGNSCHSSSFSSPSPNSAMGLALVRTIVLCGF